MKKWITGIGVYSGVLCGTSLIIGALVPNWELALWSTIGVIVSFAITLVGTIGE
jgi:hypothetical protein